MSSWPLLLVLALIDPRPCDTTPQYPRNPNPRAEKPVVPPTHIRVIKIAPILASIISIAIVIAIAYPPSSQARQARKGPAPLALKGLKTGANAGVLGIVKPLKNFTVLGIVKPLKNFTKVHTAFVNAIKVIIGPVKSLPTWTAGSRLVGYIKSINIKNVVIAWGLGLILIPILLAAVFIVLLVLVSIIGFIVFIPLLLLFGAVRMGIQLLIGLLLILTSATSILLAYAALLIVLAIVCWIVYSVYRAGKKLWGHPRISALVCGALLIGYLSSSYSQDAYSFDGSFDFSLEKPFQLVQSGQDGFNWALKIGKSGQDGFNWALKIGDTLGYRGLEMLKNMQKTMTTTSTLLEAHLKHLDHLKPILRCVLPPIEALSSPLVAIYEWVVALFGIDKDKGVIGIIRQLGGKYLSSICETVYSERDSAWWRNLQSGLSTAYDRGRSAPFLNFISISKREGA